jgi:hypothetical protein
MALPFAAPGSNRSEKDWDAKQGSHYRVPRFVVAYQFFGYAVHFGTS